MSLVEWQRQTANAQKGIKEQWEKDKREYKNKIKGGELKWLKKKRNKNDYPCPWPAISIVAKGPAGFFFSEILSRTFF